jgi:hypothetical protein
MTLKALTPLPALAMMAAALIVPTSAAHAAPMTFFANLSGANETPPTGSPRDGPRNDSAGPGSPNTASQRDV